MSAARRALLPAPPNHPTRKHLFPAFAPAILHLISCLTIRPFPCQHRHLFSSSCFRAAFASFSPVVVVVVVVVSHTSRFHRARNRHARTSQSQRANFKLYFLLFPPAFASQTSDKRRVTTIGSRRRSEKFHAA